MAFTVADGLIRLLVDEKELQRAVTASSGPAALAATQAGQTVGSRFTNAISKVAVPAAALVGGTIARSIGKATDFDEQLRVINTVAKVSDETLKGIGESILDVSRETGKATDDLTAGFYDLVSAGVPAEKAIAVLKTSAVLATGALGTTGEAVDLLTSALNAYGLEADQATRVSDIFAQSVADGKVTVAELGGTISNIAPIASAAGISLEEVAAGFAVMTAKGTPAAQAATQMRAAISALLTPNETLNKLQTKTGQTWADLAKEKGLSVALEELRVATNGNDEAFAKALGSTEAYQFALQATGENAASFAAEQDKITTAADEGGVAMGQYEEVMKSAGAQGRKLTAQLSAAAIEIGGPFVSSLGAVLSALGPMGQGLSGVAAGAGLAKAGVKGLGGALGALKKIAASGVLGPFLADLALGVGTDIVAKLKFYLAPAGQKIGSFLGSNAGKAFGIAFLAAALFALKETYDRVKAELAAQTADIATNATNQLKTATDAELTIQRDALKTGMDSLAEQARAGNFLALDPLKEIVAQYNATQTELNTRADLASKAAASAAAAGLASPGAKAELAAATQSLMDEIPRGIEKSQILAANAARAFLALPIGQQLQKIGPEGIRAGAATALGLAQGLRQNRGDIDAALAQLKDDMEHKLSPTKEVAKRIGQLFGRTLSDGLHSADPIVKAQSEGTRALIEAQLIETIRAGGEAGKKIQEELAKKLKSKDPDVRAQAQRTKSIVDEALKQQPAKTPGEKIAQDLARDIGNGNGTVARAAYNLGVTVARNVLRGVTGSGIYVPKTSATGVSGQYAGKQLPEFADGTLFAPGGLALLHEGEIVVPRRESDAIRSGTGATAPNVFGDMARAPDVTLVMPDARNRDPFEVLERARRLAGFGAFSLGNRVSTAAPSG